MSKVKNLTAVAVADETGILFESAPTKHKGGRTYILLSFDQRSEMINFNLVGVNDDRGQGLGEGFLPHGWNNANNVGKDVGTRKWYHAESQWYDADNLADYIDKNKPMAKEEDEPWGSLLLRKLVYRAARGSR